MLIQFSVKNYRSFKEKATISLVASNYDKETREFDNINYLEKFDLRVLKSAVIYGANASGKSKFIEAIMFMKHFALNSSKDTQKGDEIDVESFKLNTSSENEPSEFEVLFDFNNIIYRYGFEVNRTAVVAEWLYYKPKTKEVELFYRDFQNFDVHPKNFKKGNFAVKEKLIRDNSLLLSLAAQLNDTVATSIIDWFRRFKTISGLNEDGYQGYTVGRTGTPEYKNKILELLKAADLGIQDLQLEILDVEKLPKEMPKDLKEKIIRESKEEDTKYVSDILTSHKKYDSSKKYVSDVNFSFQNDESSGTQKFFALTGPILDTLEKGNTLIVDELDSKLHANLICKIVSLFNSKELNPNGAQLIFNTHDTNLLNTGLFRRDQIWFTEKDKYGESILFSLADFKSDEVRKTEAFEENYIRGKYGAVPFLGLFDNITNNPLGEIVFK
ncbi:MAG: abortive infection protein [Flavobacterium sp. BFFFF2]|nr:MAG: abortive infection protein [Flavobacterium sp. BFFFF2]